MLEEKQSNLVERVLGLDSLHALVDAKKPVKVIMGQTFDSGQPVDMMKYGLFMMNLHDELAREGCEVYSTWVIADHFMTDINEDSERVMVAQQALERMNFLKSLNRVYSGSIAQVLSSNLKDSSDYKQVLGKLKEKARTDKRFLEKISESIPEDRRDHPKALEYPLEELATIAVMDTDVKIGPKYELFYDGPARSSAELIGFKPYTAIHLTNALPFGDPEIEEGLKKQIDQFGVLPYKKNSKDLGDFRIDPVNDSLDKVSDLINKTSDKRALLDLCLIGRMAGERREPSKFSTSFRDVSPESFSLHSLRENAMALYNNNIHPYLNRS